MIINIAGGTGVMGRVHKPVFERAGHEVILSGRHSKPTLEEAAEQADLTIVSVPISATREVIERVGSYCNGIMDFTGVKELPLRAMLEYAKPEVEVGGLHPLYGEVDSIKGRSVVYCPTGRSREKCGEIAECFILAGAEIVRMKPEEHDFAMAILQNARTHILGAYTLLIKELKNKGLSSEQVYRIAPRPTQIMMDLAARQADERNDKLYREMRTFNHYQWEVDEKLSRCLTEVLCDEGNSTPSMIRTFLEKEQLGLAQERARKLMSSGK